MTREEIKRFLNSKFGDVRGIDEFIEKLFQGLDEDEGVSMYDVLCSCWDFFTDPVVD